MQNIIERNPNHYNFAESCKNDFKNLQENNTSTSIKEDSLKNFYEMEKESSPVPNFEFANSSNNFENLSNGNSFVNVIGQNFLKSSENSASEKNIFIGKKVKVEKVLSENNFSEEKYEKNNKKIEQEIKNKNKKIKAKKTHYSVFKINKNFELDQGKKLSLNCETEVNKSESNISMKEKQKTGKKMRKNLKKENSSDESSCSSDDELNNLVLDTDSFDEENFNPFMVDKRVSAISKVNFTKLNEIEKDERLKNLAKLVKRLRRKVRNLENRFKSNANKILDKYLSYNLGIKKAKQNQEPCKLSIDNLCKALKILRQYERFEYSDQSHVIENFVNLIANEKIQLDSINFRKISTQIRMFLDKENSSYIANKGQKITFSFPEKDVNITTKEYEFYSKYREREDIIRTIVGVPEETEKNIYPEKINFDSKKFPESQDMLRNFNNNINQKNEILKTQNEMVNNFNQILSNANKISQPNFSVSNLLNNNNSIEFQNKNINNNNIFEQIKNFQFNNNFNVNDLLSMGYINSNPSNNNPGNFHNILINSMYSNILQNFKMPKNS